jgi:hypothetical protein
MDTLLMVAVVLTAIAVIAQAGVLIGMYMTTRRLTTKAEALMDESKKLMAPIESITSNLKTVSEDLVETGTIAREQAGHLHEILTTAQNDVRGQMADVRARVLDTVDEARYAVMRPVRQYSAIASGVAEGLRTFLFGRRKRTDEIIVRDERPAA